MDVVEDVTEYCPSPFVVREALSFPGSAERLTWKSGNININGWGRSVVALRDVRVELLWLEICFDCFDNLWVVVASERVMVR